MSMPYFNNINIDQLNYEPIYKNKREIIKELLENDYELLNDIVIELRKEKIELLKSKL